MISGAHTSWSAARGLLTMPIITCPGWLAQQSRDARLGPAHASGHGRRLKMRPQTPPAVQRWTTGHFDHQTVPAMPASKPCPTCDHEGASIACSECEGAEEITVLRS